MYRRLKKDLKKCFQAPESTRKEEFLADIRQVNSSLLKFIPGQVYYIRKYIWIVSVAIFLAAVYGAYRINLNIVWCASAMVPLLALMAVTEISKSSFYGMEELELSTLYDRRSIFLSRLFILGLFNMVLMCAFLPFCYKWSVYTLQQVVLYVFVPYLLSAFFCLVFTHHIRGKQSVYICTVFSFMIGILDLLLHTTARRIFDVSYNVIWIILFLGLIFLIIAEIMKIIKKMRKQQWDFTLTD